MIPPEDVPDTTEEARKATWQNQGPNIDQTEGLETDLDIRKFYRDSLPVVDRLVTSALDGIPPLVRRVRSIVTR